MNTDWQKQINFHRNKIKGEPLEFGNIDQIKFIRRIEKDLACTPIDTDDIFICVKCLHEAYRNTVKNIGECSNCGLIYEVKNNDYDIFLWAHPERVIKRFIIDE